MRERCDARPTSTASTRSSEIAIITRAGPARVLGLKQKGHLGVGADADVTIYTPSENSQAMFELPRMVIKAGETIVEQGEIRATPDGVALAQRPRVRRRAPPRRWRRGSTTTTRCRFKNYAAYSCPCDARPAAVLAASVVWLVLGASPRNYR